MSYENHEINLNAMYEFYYGGCVFLLSVENNRVKVFNYSLPCTDYGVEYEISLEQFLSEYSYVAG